MAQLFFSKKDLVTILILLTNAHKEDYYAKIIDTSGFTCGNSYVMQ